VSASKIKTLAPIGLLVAALLISYALIKMRPEAGHHVPVKPQPLVNIETVHAQSVTIPVTAQGNVRPRAETLLVSEVSGKVVSTAEHFNIGGFFRKGDVLLSMDNSRYVAAVKRAEADVASARSALASEKGRADVAYKEWEQRAKAIKRSREATDLYLRKPQLQEAEARLAAAEADLIQARTDLANTRIIAPYDGLLADKQADVGQFISPGQSVAKLYAIDQAEVRVSIAEHTLAFLQNTDGKAAPVTLHGSGGQQALQWQGRLVRTEGVFNEKTRTMTAVISVQDPYGFLGNTEHTATPLRIGSFVRAEIEGRTLDNIIPMSLAALKPGNKVWLVDDKNRLSSRNVDVIYKTRDTAFISSGLEDGNRVSLTALSNYVSGLRVRIVQEQEEDSTEDRLKLSADQGATDEAGH
jgi:RND family efflux transporter MFP subunit